PIEKVITFLHKHSHQTITLEQAAKEAGMSPYSLSKRFKEEKGINFIDYLTALRIEKAKTLLQDPSRSLKEICYTVGYHDPNYFSRVFKRITGVSPTEYREKMRTL
ncbi:MAG: helix-turn-helix transcriptional regulator, partial [Thermicanus sp.]|nr:helix-turn-helix transcriptional regulator [Thermicanus sp.]